MTKESGKMRENIPKLCKEFLCCHWTTNFFFMEEQCFFKFQSIMIFNIDSQNCHLSKSILVTKDLFDNIVKCKYQQFFKVVTFSRKISKRLQFLDNSFVKHLVANIEMYNGQSFTGCFKIAPYFHYHPLGMYLSSLFAFKQLSSDCSTL